MKRIVVTGAGVVSSVGIGKDEFWTNIKNGKCGIDTVTRFDVTDYTTKIAAEVKDFAIENYVEKKEAKRMDLFVQYAVASAKMAVEDAKLDLENEDKNRIGVYIGSGIGGMSTFEDQHSTLLEKGPGRVSPFFIPMMISNMAVGQVAIMLGAKGINSTTVSACASATNAIGEALMAMRNGFADVIIAGGAEATVTPMAFAGFCSMKAMSTRNDTPESASTPFDATRDGFVMGEGAGILVLEELEHAKARGANIICELVGYGCTNDAYHISAPSEGGEGGARCMQMALDTGNINPNDVQYINAHGTSTPYNDKFETAAIKTVFGDHAYKMKVSSTKSMTGHLLGAAGAIEGIIIALAIQEGYAPPTIGYKNPDPDCDLDYVVNKGADCDINVALSNSLGFGGHNATIAMRKFKG